MSDVTSQMEGIQIRTMERHPQNDTILLETIVNHLGVETTSNFHLKKKKKSQSLLSILWGSILSRVHTETVESNIHLYLMEA